VVNLGWCPPAGLIDAATATYNIRSQHDRIRELLQRARAVADAALDGNAPSPDAVASAIGDIHATMVVHSAFEENALFAILHDRLSLGLEHMKRLRDEHARQRVILASLHREAAVCPELPLLAAKLTFVTFWLMADMDEEERTMLTGATSASACDPTLGTCVGK
jgi:hypothetical protein